MLKHTTISQINFHGYKIALVETNRDYVVATDYKGHNDSWGQGYYFPKVNDPREDLKTRELAANAYVNTIAKEISYWL